MLYSLGVEFEDGTKADFSFFNLGEAHAAFVTTGDSSLDRLKKSSPEPVFQRLTFTGPAEISLPRRQELSVRVPRQVDVGSLRRVVLGPNAAVNISAFTQMRLLNSIGLDIDAVEIIEDQVPPEQLRSDAAPASSLVAGVPLPPPDRIVKRLVVKYRGTPEVALSDRASYRADRLLKSAIASSSADSASPGTSTLVVESDSALKLKRGGNAQEIILTNPLADGNTVASSTASPSTQVLAIDLTPNSVQMFRHVAAQFQASGKRLADIRRLHSATAEAVKVFNIPMKIETEDIATWDVEAVRTVEGKTKLLNASKLPTRVQISIGPQLTGALNDTASLSLQKEVEAIMGGSAKDAAVAS